jgi:starch synthase (maltosyl-transferring)
VLVVVNLDPAGARVGAVDVPGDIGLPPAFTVRDELTGDSWGWSVGRNYVRLAPGRSHVLTVQA